MSNSNMGVRQQPRFSAAISTPGYLKLINNTLGDPERAKRFVASITSAVATNPMLQDCDAGTILAGGLLGESLNLSPSPQLGQYYLVPFECKVKGDDGKVIYLVDENGNKQKDARGRWIALTEKKAQFVLGYKGYIQLAVRSGQYRHINVVEVKDGELLRFDPFYETFECAPMEDMDARECAQTVGYFAMFEYINGFRKTMYWSKKKMLIHADTYSPAFSAAIFQQINNGEIAEQDMWKYSSFWYKNFDAMAKKTMLRQLISKWGIMSTEMRTAFEQDSSVAAIAGSGDIVTTKEELFDVAQANYELVQPEAEQVVEKVDLSDI